MDTRAASGIAGFRTKSKLAVSLHDAVDGDAEGHGDVQRLLHPELGDLERQIALVEHVLGDSFHLVAYDQAEREMTELEIVEPTGFIRDFERRQRNACRLQLRNCFQHVVVLAPGDYVLGSQGSAMDRGVVRRSGVAGEMNMVDRRGVRRPEDRSDIVNGPNIVNHHLNRVAG